MIIDEETLFEQDAGPETEMDNIESVRKKFKGQMYLDPTYDPAFKALFDSEDALKDFLDGVLGLEGENKIKTLRFNFDKALIFRVPQEKKVVFDIFATTNNNRFFNIEMQRLESNFFIDRTILYKAFHIIKGRKEMELSEEFKALSDDQKEYRRYELPECISVWICNFDLPDAKGEIRDEWGLYSDFALKRMLEENKAAVPISKKNKYIFFSVPNFKKSIEEVNGAVDKWLYLLNHAKDGNELPNFGSEIMEEAIGRIKVDKASKELLAAQEKFMTTKEDYESWAAGLVIHAREKALAEGEAKGYAAGEAKGAADERSRNETANAARDKKIAEYLRSIGVSAEGVSTALAIK